MGVSQNIRPAYRADIDGLRAIGVLAVVAYHAFPSLLPGGFVGVDVFFVVSGYLISLIIMESLEKSSFSFSEFYARRVRRIFPALLLVMVAVLAFGWIALLAGEYQQLGKHVGFGAAFVSNFVLWFESGYFDNAAASKPLLHLWSLGVEEQFYIFWPFFLWLAWRLRFNFLAAALTLAVFSFAANIILTAYSPAAAFYSPFSRCWELMLGAVLAYGAIHRRRRWNASDEDTESSLTGAGQVASLLGAGLVLLSFVLAREEGFPGWQVLLPTIGTALLIWAGPRAIFNAAVLANRPIVWLGLISYPLYLWHWPLLSFVRIVHGEADVAMRGVVVLASIILAASTYLLLESPLRRARRPALVAIPLSILMAVVSGLGFEVSANDGMPLRAVVQENPTIASGEDGGYPPLTRDCPFLDTAQKALFKCYIQIQSPPRFALVGDSKAGALFFGLFRTANPNATWVYYGSGVNGRFSALLSSDPAYGYINRAAVETALGLIEKTKSVEVVAIADASRVLFHLKNDHSIADMPKSANHQAAFDALDAVVSRLLAAGKKVVLVIDNPTLPYPEDCLARRTSSSFVNGLLAAPLNPDCRISISRQLELSKQYRDMLQAVRDLHPDQVSLFDTIPILCDEGRQVCEPTKDGRFLYRNTDHISQYASRLVGQQLNRVLNAEVADMPKRSGGSQ
jgi:peptidoglycan/LPS O-acetylase OafA/YrhL